MDADDRRLLILRHAKSDWPLGVADFDRPLADRGRRDAPVAGRLLRDLGRVDAAYVSSARRTRQTWALAAAELAAPPALLVESDDIYAASVATLLELVTGIPDHARTAVIVGHNPGCEDLAELLASPDSDTDALGQLRLKYPTAGLAVLEHRGSWTTLGPGGARLRQFLIPRG